MSNTKGIGLVNSFYDGMKITNFKPLILGLLSLSSLFIISRYNYLVFHTLAEFISILVAWSLFLIVWNTREIARNDALIFLGIAYFYIGGVDLFHTLAYRGMGVFNADRGANPATQLWIIARYMESLSFCIVPLILGRRIKISVPVGIYSVISILAFFTIFVWRVFPDCYVEGYGLTAFKKISEYVICILLSIALFLLYKKRKLVNKKVYLYLNISIILTIICELMFTFYISVYDLSNLIGHFLKIVGFYFVYKAVIITTLKKPFDLLFKEISDKENKLYFNFVHRLSSGELRDVEVYSGPILVGQKELLYSIIHDVTERKKADTRLKDSEFFLRESQRIGSIGTYKLDMTTGLWESSAVLDSIFGIDIAYIHSVEGWHDIIHPEDREMMANYLTDEVLGKGNPFDKEYSIIRKSDGEHRYVRGRGELSFDREGKILSMIGTIIDITESKISELALLKSSTLNQQIISSANEGIIVYGLDLRYKVWNPFMEKLTGILASDVVGKFPIDVFPFLSDVGVIERLELALKGQRVDSVDFFFTNGEKSAWVQDESTTLREESGSIVGVIATVQNITERKQMVEALKESEDQMRNLIEQAPYGISVIDSKTGQILEVNSKYAEIIGISKKEMISGDWMKITHPDDVQEDLDNMNLLKNGQISSYSMKKRYIHSNGSIVWVELNVNPIQINDKDNSRLMLIVKDITEQKNAEDEKAKLQEQIYHSSKLDAVGQLAGGMAHDFNNMLSGIMSSAQLLKSPKRNLDDKSSKYVDMILQASERASKTIAKLLTFGRKESLSLTVIDVHQVIDETVSITDSTFDKQIVISVEKKSQNSKVFGDRSNLQNVILNLCINASHAMDSGGDIRIITENINLNQSYCDTSTFSIQPGNYCKISICDTGSGMPPEILKRIFEPFYTTKKQGKGTGLGLSAVYGTIQDHHGSIEVLSEVGLGTTFNILLPCSDEQTKIEKENPIMAGSGTILLVDDEEFNRVLNKDIFESLGYKILLAEDGLESVEIFSKKHSEIDIVLMDMIMPRMNGSEAFYKMKELDENCKIIITSGYTRDENIDELIQYGLAGFINKPYKISEISQLLASIQKK